MRICERTTCINYDAEVCSHCPIFGVNFIPADCTYFIHKKDSKRVKTREVVIKKPSGPKVW